MDITPMTSTPKGVSFMVHRLGTEVGPLKQVRELLINAFEAIQAYQKAHPKEASFKGPFTFRHGPRHHALTPGIADTGRTFPNVLPDVYRVAKYFADAVRRPSAHRNPAGRS